VIFHPHPAEPSARDVPCALSARRDATRERAALPRARRVAFTARRAMYAERHALACQKQGERDLAHTLGTATTCRAATDQQPCIARSFYGLFFSRRRPARVAGPAAASKHDSVGAALTARAPRHVSASSRAVCRGCGPMGVLWQPAAEYMKKSGLAHGHQRQSRGSANARTRFCKHCARRTDAYAWRPCTARPCFARFAPLRSTGRALQAIVPQIGGWVLGSPDKLSRSIFCDGSA
jgi:hypothetical protein